ncbi:hypothetical protein [Jiella sp. M17.18]|uniref:hypothetical protein n=1 Tax=Jiella sp. M17.18 TaxID=3234247 RepID=UPI0034DFADD7
MGLKVKDSPAMKELFKAISRLDKTRVLVGIPAEKAGRDDGSPLNNAEIGYIQEFGAPEQNIPARPFLIPGVAGAKEKFTPHLKAAAKLALSGKVENIDVPLHRAGLVAQNAVHNKIEQGPFVPLAPATLYKRKHRKEAPRDGEKPLIDKGELLRSVTYVVTQRRKGDDL